MARVVDGSFTSTKVVWAQGRFRISIEQVGEIQNEDLLPRLRALPGPRRWDFELQPIGLVQRIPWDQILRGLREEIQAARRLPEDAELAAQEAKGFDDLIRRIGAMSSRLDSPYLPGASRELDGLNHSLRTMMTCFWKKRGQWAPGPNPPDSPLIHGRPFTVDGFLQALDGIEDIAGRELALWAIKDAKAVGHTAEHEELLRKFVPFPGVASAFDAPESLVRKLPERR